MGSVERSVLAVKVKKRKSESSKREENGNNKRMGEKGENEIER